MDYLKTKMACYKVVILDIALEMVSQYSVTNTIRNTQLRQVRRYLLHFLLACKEHSGGHIHISNPRCHCNLKLTSLPQLLLFLLIRRKLLPMHVSTKNYPLVGIL